MDDIFLHILTNHKNNHYVSRNIPLHLIGAIRMLIYKILYTILCCLIGAIPFGLLISRGIAKMDITSRGSGNIGATNVARELGLKWGFITLIMDLSKGFIPVFLLQRYVYANFDIGLFIVSLATLLGHQFSPFLKFRGGKGVATALGIFIAISPVSAVIALFIFIITVYISDFISLGSMVAACSMPVILFFTMESRNPALASLIMACLICFRHKDNIYRLVRGNERKWRKRPIKTEDQEDDPVHHQNRNVL
jgi:glycerol-3-phosphate acyltransferase PlsY